MNPQLPNYSIIYQKIVRPSEAASDALKLCAIKTAIYSAGFAKSKVSVAENQLSENGRASSKNDKVENWKSRFPKPRNYGPTTKPLAVAAIRTQRQSICQNTSAVITPKMPAVIHLANRVSSLQ
ncbi:MAG: hypothetical protein CMM47_09140 [Rhodospirillaceae bacterium]|nr:hypothetical protein [Rhodospirillaceae bacterium]